MGKATGFREFPRQVAGKLAVDDRIQHWKEFSIELPIQVAQQQGSRCMDCGVPFCHSGCPLGNVIPDWNDLVYKDRWQQALRALHATNNFPEFTGRVCPAPCETSCVLGINDLPVTIKQIERLIVDRGWREGWIVPEPASIKTGKKVAIVGSGPAGLAAAQQLARSGHQVTVFEKSDRIGGLLRYGIPNFKMEKHQIDRRIVQMQAEGVEFVKRVHVGESISVEELKKNFNAVLLAGGAEQPRDISVPGRGLKGIYFAMDYLRRQNQKCEGDEIPEWDDIDAKSKRVAIIGGGDTGADCLGTCIRQGAVEIHQLELLPKPPASRAPQTPWPMWPLELRTESSHEEGGIRYWSTKTTGFSGDADGNVAQIHTERVGPGPSFELEEGSGQTLDVELVLIATGFLGPVRQGLLEQLNLEATQKGSVRVDSEWMTSQPGIFAAGDMQRGQSLVVWAIASGRQAAAAIDAYLRG